jgi:hypothetical protein
MILLFKNIRGVHKSHRGGYIALFSTILISSVLLILVSTLAQKALATRAQMLLIEDKEVSRMAARSCVESARVAVMNDAGVALTNLTLPVAHERCTIHSLARHSEQKSEVVTSAIVKKSHTYLRAIIDRADAQIISIDEIPTL